MPDLDDLRPQLGIPEIITGRRYALTSPSGIVTDDLEALHTISDEDGSVRLLSGNEFSHYLYRGQLEEYTPCLPSLGRLNLLKTGFRHFVEIQHLKTPSVNIRS